MNSDADYIVEFENKLYSLTKKQVDELLIISKYCYLYELPKGLCPINLAIRLNNKEIVTGYIIEFEGFNPLSPNDVFIPVRFTIKHNDEERSLTFLDIESIDVDYH